MIHCYGCEAEGTTREHVPPLSFFPRGFRRDLWTVRACEEHNIANSKDVEYVRNLVVNHRNSKGPARLLAQGAASRSFGRSAALFFETYQREQARVIDVKEEVVFRLNFPRIERVMKAIARGIHFRETGEISEGEWHVLIPAYQSPKNLVGTSNNLADSSISVDALPFTAVATPEPAVFRYGQGIFVESFDVVYRFEFYEGFQVYTWRASSETFQAHV